MVHLHPGHAPNTATQEYRQHQPALLHRPSLQNHPKTKTRLADSLLPIQESLFRNTHSSPSIRGFWEVTLALDKGRIHRSLNTAGCNRHAVRVTLEVTIGMPLLTAPRGGSLGPQE